MGTSEVSHLDHRSHSRHNEQFLDSLIEYAGDAIYLHDLSGRILRVNQLACDQLGYTRAELQSKFVWDIDAAFTSLEQCLPIWRPLAFGKPITAKGWHRCKDGTTFPVELRLAKMKRGEEKLILAFARDVTERHKADEALRESESRFRTLIDDLHTGVVLQDARDRILVMNPAAASMLGLKQELDEEITSRDPRWKLVREDGSDYPLDQVPSVVAARTLTPVRDAVIGSMNLQTGKRIWLHVNAMPRLTPDGSLLHVLVTLVDITEFKRVEEALRESQVRYETLFRLAPDAMFVIAAEGDRTGRIVAANEEAHAMHGYPPGALVGMPISSLDVPEDAAHVPERLRRLAGGETLRFEVEHLRKDGTPFPVEVTATRIVLDGKAHVLAFDRDITERKQAEAKRRDLEDQLKHSQKLESLGVLAGGIAHDFNNLLTGILGHSDLALRALPADSPVRVHLNEVIKGAQAASELARQMLAYSGKGRFVIEPIDLSSVVRDLTSLLQVSISKKGALHVHLADGLPPVDGDVTQLRQIVMNLIINASEAIGDQTGTISVTTGIRTCDAAELPHAMRHDQLQPGPYVFIRVADTGSGMTAETIEKIFDPFFSTKATGRGLGLSVVLGIVRGHYGTLSVESRPGQGTTFTVLLPVSREAPRPESSARATTQAWRGTGTVLVVDDEELVRTLACSMFTLMGFTVLAARDGREALEVYRQHARQIDLVLLDMTMPHLDGQETLAELRRIRTDVRAILTSGYSEQDTATRFAGHEPASFLQKPFDYETLVATVKSVIEA